jgi:hypothetical protein
MSRGCIPLGIKCICLGMTGSHAAHSRMVGDTLSRELESELAVSCTVHRGGSRHEDNCYLLLREEVEGWDRWYRRQGSHLSDLFESGWGSRCLVNPSYEVLSFSKIGVEWLESETVDAESIQ